MSNYVGLEVTSPDSIQEDEELIEAVEALVETCAVSVQRSIEQDWQDLQGRVGGFFNWAFPVLLEYRHQSRSVHDDLEHLAIAAVLFVLVFVILAPYSSWSRRGESRQPRQQSQQQQQQQKQRSRSSTGRFSFFLRCNQSASWSEDIEEDLSAPADEEISSYDKRWSTLSSDNDETDEERFEKNWISSISVSRYHKLVLPPSCRLSAEKSKASTKTKTAANALSDVDQRSADISIALNDDSENPVKRLHTYFSHFLHLLKKIISYDDAGAGWTILQWLRGIMMLQKRRRRSNVEVEAVTDAASALEVEEEKEMQTNHENNQSNYSRVDQEQQTPTITTTRSSNNLHPQQQQQDDSATIMTTATDTTPASSLLVVVDDKDDETDVGPADQQQRQLHPHLGPLHEEDRVEEGEEENSSLDYEEKKGEEYDPATEMSGTTSAPSSPRMVIDDAHSSSLKRNKNNNNRHRLSSDATIYHDVDDNNDDNMIASPPCLKKISLLNKHPSLQTCNDDSNSKRQDADASTASTASTTGGGTGSDNHHLALEHDFVIPECRTGTAGEHFLEESTTAKEEVQQQQPQQHPPDKKVSSSLLEPPEFPHMAMPPLATSAIEEHKDGNNHSSFFFEAARCQESLKRMSVEVPVPDKNGYILGDEFLPTTNNDSTSQYTPLLVFVNSRAGPQQGHLLITQLRRLLNPIQVWDLADGGPETILESFLVFTRLRILVCGGDGTVSWIVSALEGMKNIRGSKKWPPIAILPLGTGNDLARIHGWGGGYNNESLITVLEQISESYISLLDIWEVTIDSKQSKAKKSNKKDTQVKTFFNYLGVGADAQAALQVHYLRESRPEWFFSRLVNKAWYGVFGAEDIIMASSVNVRKEIKLIADGVEVTLPPDSQGIIILNIDSYAGGVPLWSQGTPCSRSGNDARPPIKHGGKWSSRRSQSMNTLNNLGRWNPIGRVDSLDDMQMLLSEEERINRVTACDRESSCQDGILEIVSIRGAFHLGQIKVGLSNAQRLCQCREAVITIKNKVAVQVDGEPWRQRPCTLTVRRKQAQAVMLHRSADDGGVETEMSKLLDWAEERQIINSEVHTLLMKEYSRRIESKTRKRRVREQDNIMYTLKKAIAQSATANNLQSSQSWHGGIAF